MDLSAVNDVPDDIEALKAALIASRLHSASVESDLAAEKAHRSDDQALIAHLNLMIAKLKRDKFGPHSERSRRLLDQMELQLEELEATATEDELAAEMTAARTSNVSAFVRKRPARKPFPAHVPRERIVIPGPVACACCGGNRLVKLGEDVTETIESVPRTWKVIQYVREKFSCRDCENIDQAPAPFHVTPRGWAGPNLLAMILFEKFGQHQPLNRQAERYAREGVDLSLSTLADQVGRRIDALFAIERDINGKSADERRSVRQDLSLPLVTDLEAWMRDERAKLSRHAVVAEAMDYMLKRWDAFIRFLTDGRICLTNNAAERALRGIALGRKSWLFAGSGRGGERAAIMYSLIVTAKMNDIDPQAWLADVLARINEHPMKRIDDLLPWNWKTGKAGVQRAA